MSSKFRIVFIIPLLFYLLSCGPGKNREQVNKHGADSIRVAIENLSQKIKSDGSDPQLLNLRARYYLKDHQPDMALKDINQALSLAPKEPLYYITLSDIYLMMGQPDNCEDALKKAVSISPDNNDALLKLARLSLIKRDYKGLNDYVNKAIGYRKNNPQAYYLHGLALLENGDTARAVQDFMTANSQDQSNYEVLIQLGEIFSLKKDPLAAGYLKNALRIRPGSREALYMLGMFYQETGQFEPAIQTYTILSKVDTTYRNAPYNIGYIYLVYLHDFDNAIDYFTRAIKRDPAYLEAWFNRGYAYELKKDYTHAASDYQKALELKPNYDKAVEGLNRLDKIRYGK